MKLSYDKTPVPAKLSFFRILNGDTEQVIGYAVGWRHRILAVRN